MYGKGRAGQYKGETRCYLRADVDECVRTFPDVEFGGMSGFDGHPRPVVVAAVVGSLRRITLKSGDVRISAPADALALDARAAGTR